MFNLLVRGAGWSESRDTMPGSRVFKFTESDIREQFEVSGQPMWDRLKRLPALFMEEGKSNEVARVGRILDVRRSGRDFQLEYSFEQNVPVLANSQLVELAWDLGIEDFEFHHTHWAVKPADLYRLLYQQRQPRSPAPKVFSVLAPENIESVLVSVMMPFDASFGAVYEAISSAAEQAGLRCRRADDTWENPAVIQDVVSLIDRARVVVCDLTGKNANVFYEAGIAHTLGRDVILIAQSGHTMDTHKEVADRTGARSSRILLSSKPTRINQSPPHRAPASPASARPRSETARAAH